MKGTVSAKFTPYQLKGEHLHDFSSHPQAEGFRKRIANLTASLWTQESTNTSVLEPPRSRNPPGITGWCEGIARGALMALINVQSLS